MTTPVNLNSTITKRVDLLETELENETVIMHVKSGQYLDLKDVTSDIWRRLAQPTRISDLLDELVSEYDVEASICETEVLAFMAQLVDADLVEVTTA